MPGPGGVSLNTAGVPAMSHLTGMSGHCFFNGKRAITVSQWFLGAVAGLRMPLETEHSWC